MLAHNAAGIETMALLPSKCQLHSTYREERMQVMAVSCVWPLSPSSTAAPTQHSSLPKRPHMSRHLPLTLALSPQRRALSWEVSLQRLSGVLLARTAEKSQPILLPAFLNLMCPTSFSKSVACILLRNKICHLPLPLC